LRELVDGGKVYNLIIISLLEVSPQHSLNYTNIRYYTLRAFFLRLEAKTFVSTGRFATWSLLAGGA
jgi:hypothetical protein